MLYILVHSILHALQNVKFRNIHQIIKIRLHFYLIKQMLFKQVILLVVSKLQKVIVASSILRFQVSNKSTRERTKWCRDNSKVANWEMKDLRENERRELFLTMLFLDGTDHQKLY